MSRSKDDPELIKRRSTAVNSFLKCGDRNGHAGDLARIAASDRNSADGGRTWSSRSRPIAVLANDANLVKAHRIRAARRRRIREPDPQRVDCSRWLRIHNRRELAVRVPLHLSNRKQRGAIGAPGDLYGIFVVLE